MTDRNVPVDLNDALANRDRKCIDAPLEWLDSHIESLVRTYLPPEPGLAYAPRDVGAEERTCSVLLPAVTLHQFENAIISPQSSSVFLGDRIVVERVEGVDPALCDFRTGHLISHDTERGNICIEGGVIDIPRGIFLGGNVASNYYHLLIEILPKLQHIASETRFANYPLLVDESVERIPNLKTLVEIASLGHPVLALPAHRAYRVGSLAYVSAPNTLPLNLLPEVPFKLEYTLTRPSSIQFLRERFTAVVPASNANSPKRIFFKRKPGMRDYNQDEISAIFAEHGFVDVFMEQLSIVQQVRLMSQADIVAGPTGAAWANLTFAREGAEALCWMADSYADFAGYSNLAKAVGVNLHYLRYPAGSSSSRVLHALNYHLEPAKVRQAIQQLWGLGATAPTATVKVSKPAKFRSGPGRGKRTRSKSK